MVYYNSHSTRNKLDIKFNGFTIHETIESMRNLTFNQFGYSR